ncbi:DNA cytosine methyltransferase [Maricaulis maris]|uniref:DNA cytosine methyltransferase n=1 Tax=Maricaulis maris TaxID=74318 RepID=UPI003A8F3567
MKGQRPASIAAVDLFCGAGGLTLGLEQAGIPVVEGVDIDPKCEYAYTHNTSARYRQMSVTRYGAPDIAKALGGADVRVLAGCAPCQPFSTYAQGVTRSDHKRWSLLRHFGKLAEEAKPQIVTMENVWPLAKHRAFDRFVSRLRRAGYRVNTYRVDCREYGIPQSRVRLVLLASQFGEIKLIEPTHTDKKAWASVRSVLEGLAHLEAGRKDDKDALHVCSKLSELNYRRMLASKPGGTWRDWPEELRAACHSKETGKTYPAVYGRMEWDLPAPTITGQCFGFGNGRFGHPEQNRAISLREAALLQSFPMGFSFAKPGDPVHMKSIGRMIGNAVPPRLGQVIGQSIKAHLSDRYAIE